MTVSRSRSSLSARVPLPNRLLVVIGGAALAVALGVDAISDERDAREAASRGDAEAVMAQVEAELDLALQVLRSVGAYLERSDDVSPSEFARFTEDLAPRGRTPWRALAVAVGANDPGAAPWEGYVSRWADELGEEGYPAFERFPPDTDGDTRSAVILVAPAASRPGVHGYDMTSDPVRREAVRRSSLSGEVEVSSAVTLSQDEAGEPTSLLLVSSISPDALAPDADFALVSASLTPATLLGGARSMLGLSEARYRARVVRADGAPVLSFESSTFGRQGFAERSLRTAGPVAVDVPLGPHRLMVEWQGSPETARAPISAGFPPAGAVLLVTVLSWLLLWRIQSEQQRLEEQLRRQEQDLRASEEVVARSQRREALGRLTGGVAHDFNNLLSVVIGSLDLMSARVEPDEETERLRANALAAAERGARLTQSLLTLGRQATLQPEVFDVAEVLETSRVILRASVPEKIDLVIQPTGEASWVRADRTQFEAALLNLVINARDAMREGGILTVSKYLATLPLDAENSPNLPRGEYVVLSVRDTGVGMSPSVLVAATDPFFTTKEPGAGTGLGLSTVLGFARQSGGDVVIESIEGRGTWVRVFLPCAQPEERDDGGAAHEGTGDEAEVRVLVVEDEDAVRKVIHRQLERLGYVVVTAESGDRAIALLEAGERPDLVLSDVVMPGLNDGADVARVARRLEIPIILMSGYPKGLSDSGAPDDVRLLAKPFRADDLVQAIRDELANGNVAANAKD